MSSGIKQPVATADGCPDHQEPGLSLDLDTQQKDRFMRRTVHIDVLSATHSYQVSPESQGLRTNSVAGVSARLSLKFNMSKPNFSNMVTMSRKHIWGLDFN